MFTPKRMAGDERVPVADHARAATVQILRGHTRRPGRALCPHTFHSSVIMSARRRLLAEPGGPGPAGRGDALQAGQVHPEHLAVVKEQRAQGLVLGGGGHFPPTARWVRKAMTSGAPKSRGWRRQPWKRMKRRTQRGKPPRCAGCSAGGGCPAHLFEELGLGGGDRLGRVGDAVSRGQKRAAIQPPAAARVQVRLDEKNSPLAANFHFFPLFKMAPRRFILTAALQSGSISYNSALKRDPARQAFPLKAASYLGRAYA